MKMTKEEFKEMFVECFSLDLDVGWDGYLNLKLRDNDTREVLVETYVSLSSIKSASEGY